MPIKYSHTNLIAKNWRRLAQFYQDVFGCVPIPPQRDLFGKWLDRATGLKETHITGVHLLLPGYGDHGPTLELFQYDSYTDNTAAKPNATGFTHLAFAVGDVAATAENVRAHGGSSVGDLTERRVTGVGLLTFQYVTDPEGNIIEIQHWEKSPI